MTKRKKVSKIGGQAVLEGVMMRGVSAYATAVRNPSGEIVIESERLPSQKKWWMRVPILRGVINFFSMMLVGIKITMRSAEVYGEEFEQEQPGKFEKWLSKSLHVDVMTIAMVMGVVLGVGLAVALFMFVPNLISGGITGAITKHIMGADASFSDLFANAGVGKLIENLIEGFFRIVMFVAYIVVISLMKDINRLFRYHGAEHKTISCYEHDLPLTVENARGMSKHHDRCGTNFMVIVMLISIVLFTLVEGILAAAFGWTADSVTNSKVLQRLISLGIRLALLPFVAGISYEVLKLLARWDNWFVRILKAPGMALQLLTTKEPDDSMLEVAIAAFQRVQELDANPEMPTTTFAVKKSYDRCRHEVEGLLQATQDAAVLADWIFVEVTKTKRSELGTLATLTEDQYKQAVEFARRVAKNEPLQYVVGNTDFYGYPIRVDSRVLIPRPETEEVVEAALGLVQAGDEVLDMCTGSGAIAIVLAKNSPAKVTAADISEEALDVARQNAIDNQAEVLFVQSDLYQGIEGKFDMIVSNPPYIRHAEMATLPPVVQQEPALALDGGEDGLDFYRRIIAQAPLKEGGRFVLEIGADQGEAVAELLREAGFASVEIRQDLNGLDRIAIAR